MIEIIVCSQLSYILYNILNKCFFWEFITKMLKAPVIVKYSI